MVEVNQGLYKYAQITVALVKLKNQDQILAKPKTPENYHQLIKIRLTKT